MTPESETETARRVDAVVGSRIAARRSALGLSQTALGQAIGVSCQQIQKYESGQNRVSACRLHAMGLALALPAAAFFPETSDAPEDLGLTRFLTASPEGRALASSFALIESRAVRKAVAQLVSVLAAPA
mgnify:CR=1 FL=1